MSKSAIYFFAEYPVEFAAWAGLAAIIREVRPDLTLTLIYAREKLSSNYEWDFILKRFDSAHEITRIAWAGNWRAGITGKNLYLSLRQGFPAARRVAAELKAISFQPDSLAFVFNGLTLNEMLFLRRIKSAAGVNSVLITEQRDDLLLSDYVPNYSQAYYFNLYSHFFGTAYLDMFWLRTKDGGTGQRDARFRTRPADFVFRGIYAPKRCGLKRGQTFIPLYMKDRTPAASSQSVVLFGQPFDWEPSLATDACYHRYNELIDMIRTKHSGARFVYKPHPGETAEQRAKVDLKGFEVVDNLSSEALVMQDQTISTTYAFTSTSIFTAACLGVKSYFLFPLFDNKCVPEALMSRYEDYCRSEVHPEMCLRSVDNLMDNKNDYDPSDLQAHVRTSSIRMLEVLGVFDSLEDKDLEPGITVTPEDRWGNGVHPWPLRRLGRIVR
ncbi:MAG: hypothetical protein Q8Q07_07420 [Dehalococcoidales bacterium]|nr:hypothetical protein [Dehalococcoidales bacterium]